MTQKQIKKELARQDKIRKKNKWPMAFISCKLPHPKTKAEKFAFDILGLDHKTGKFKDAPNCGPVTFGVMEVLNAIEIAYVHGQKNQEDEKY